MNEPRPDSRGAAADEIVKLFPGALGPWSLRELEKPQPPQFAGPQALVRALYAQGPHTAEITVQAGRARPEQGRREVYREAPPQRDGSLVMVSLANGFSFAASSRTADAASLEALLGAIDLSRAEALKAAKP